MIGLVIFVFVMIIISVVAALVVGWLSDEVMFGVIALVFMLFITFVTSTWNYFTVYHGDHWAVCNVTGKDRGGDDGSYRIYTSDCGQLANEDSLLRAKFDSADIWQSIPDSGPVELRIAGFRNGFFSQFPNVFEVREMEG